MGDVIFVTGTKREAAVLRGSGMPVLAIGGNGAGLAGRLSGARAVISFGMAGALSPDLRIGDWVIGDQVYGVANAISDQALVAGLAAQFPQAHVGGCYADGQLIGDRAEKARLSASTGAIVADMESHLVADAARALGLPFAVLRCISDEAEHSLPPAIAVAMRPDGGLALGKIAGSLLANPGQIPSLIACLGQFKRGYAAMQAGTKDFRITI